MIHSYQSISSPHLSHLTHESLVNAGKVVCYIELHNSRLYGHLYEMVIMSGRINFNALASLDTKN